MPGMPTPGSAWPTPEWALAFRQYDENDAWFSGDQTKLQRVYETAEAGRSRGDNPATHYNRTDGTRRSGGLRGYLSRMFNGKIVPNDQHRTRIHAPVAGNLATLSSDLLMAEPPTFRLLDADAKATRSPVMDRMDEILNGPATHRTLSEAAELTAGIGASVLTTHWDRSVSDAPWIQASPCDAAIPEFVGERLVAVNLYTLHVDESKPIADDVYIHIERHESGRIIHGLYRTKIEATYQGFSGLGETVPLDTVAGTAHIPGIPGSQRGDLENTVVLPTGITSLTASWWRNMPTKTFRKYGNLKMLGRADFEGVEQLLDAVDEVWSSWMRDIKIARARLIVPESFLEVQGPGLGGAFDDDQEILTALAFTNLDGDGGTISAHQFEIRYQEHAGTLLALTKEITQSAGYSLSTYGDHGDGQASKTATEVVDRTTLTERTRDKKFRYFEEAASRTARALMELDAAHYGGSAIPASSTLDIQITELSQIDPEKEARVYQYLRSAMAASTETLVRAQHPDWQETQIAREVILIQQESGLMLDEVDAGTKGRSTDPNNPDDPDNTDNVDDNPIDEQAA